MEHLYHVFSLDGKGKMIHSSPYFSMFGADNFSQGKILKVVRLFVNSSKSLSDRGKLGKVECYA